MINCRRKARESALQALFQCDALGEWNRSCIDTYFTVFQRELTEDDEANENLSFCRSLITGVVERLDSIDTHISAASTHWSMARMSRVDRNILRLATYEIAFIPEIPTNVTINEAIEIAKRYGTDDSPMFINGVLDNIARALSNPAKAQSALRAVKSGESTVANSAADRISPPANSEDTSPAPAVANGAPSAQASSLWPARGIVSRDSDN